MTDGECDGCDAARSAGVGPVNGHSSFIWPVRVYYEDTDASGVVYHAAYLAYLERARTEWLRAQGWSQQMLRVECDVAFTVARMELDYLHPARLDDELRISVTVAKSGRASFVLHQAVMRGKQSLCRARVRIGCVGARSFRPRRLPFSISHLVVGLEQPDA